MKFALDIRVTRRRRCRAGFYLLINGIRLHYKTRSAALGDVEGWLKLQTVEICTVNAYVDRNRGKILSRMPKGTPKGGGA